MWAGNRKGIYSDHSTASLLDFEKDSSSFENGITSAFLVPNKGSIRGAGAVVNLLPSSAKDRVLNPDGAFGLSYRGGAGEGYPSNILGVIALFVVTGNDLGWVECILLSLLPGIAVDAPIHILEPFAFSHAHGRVNKARFALLELGVSVLGGAITTLVPNFILFGAAMPFFQSFGKVVVYAIVLALVLSLTALIASLMVFGTDTFEHGHVFSCFKDDASDGEKKPATPDAAGATPDSRESIKDHDTSIHSKRIELA
jgi:hypothetical protein